MKDDIFLEGTKKEIIDELMAEMGEYKKADGIDEFKKLVSQAIDFLEENQETLLTDDEEFQMDNLRSYERIQGLMARDAEYFIGIKKSIYILSLVIGKIVMCKTNTVLESLLCDFLEALLPKEDIAFFKKLDKMMGESCIALEAAQNRENGIDANYFLKFRGECIHYDFHCSLCQDGHCNCDKEKTRELCKKLCKKHVLKEDDNRYFYTDIL